MVNQLDIPIPKNTEEASEPEDTNDHLEQYKSVANETCLVSISPQSQMDNECTKIAPGECRQPKSILNDKFCEELSFSHLFPTDKFGYKVKTNINLRPLKYFNQKLLHFSQGNLQGIQIKLFLQAMFCKAQMNVAMRRISTPVLKAGIIILASWKQFQNILRMTKPLSL